MKYIYIIVIIALLVGGYWWYSANQNETSMGDEQTESMNDTQSQAAANTEEANEGTNEAAAEGDASANADATVGASIDLNAGDAKTVDIVGTNYKFDVTEIRVKEGDTVTINLTSGNGFHDWVVDAFNASTDRVNTGENTSVTFTADKAGTYEYYCSVGNHRALGMVGKLIVEPAQ